MKTKKQKTMQELLAKQRAIEADPKNRNPQKGSIWLYTKNAQRRLDKIAFEITELLRQKKEQQKC